MARVYVSCGFGSTEIDWGDWAARALRDNGQEPIWYGSGSGSSDAALTQAKSSLPSCRALVAFVSHRGGGQMPPGVRDELVLAVSAGIPVIAFWDPQVTKVDGLLAQAVIKRVPFPGTQEEAVAAMQELLGWTRKLDADASRSALLAIGALVGGIWLLRKFGVDEEEEDDSEE